MFFFPKRNPNVPSRLQPSTRLQPKTSISDVSPSSSLDFPRLFILSIYPVHSKLQLEVWRWQPSDSNPVGLQDSATMNPVVRGHSNPPCGGQHLSTTDGSKFYKLSPEDSMIRRASAYLSLCDEIDSMEGKIPCIVMRLGKWCAGNRVSWHLVASQVILPSIFVTECNWDICLMDRIEIFAELMHSLFLRLSEFDLIDCKMNSKGQLIECDQEGEKDLTREVYATGEFGSQRKRPRHSRSGYVNQDVFAFF
ncbi:hypothetical protein COLO4_04238 [Corchorus olitorius]|uniref:Uncharacterized protein n=1 Tax=Corchorus olitorius TaxID=93759 RepID=A0A1R3KUV3_9ROSI|nr:hypothetical protein COLO4_04238 [Corchorus olitorius]